MLKSFKELRAFDVSPYVEKRDGLDYLNWAKCVELLHENGAEEVWFEPVINPATNSSLFMTDKVFADKNGVTNQCYEVAVKIHIDDKEFEYRTPLMNGSNPVKDNSMSQQRIWNAQTRAFVKGVAVHTGLGFGLWVKEEMATAVKPDLTSMQNIMLWFNKFGELVTEKMNTLGLSEEEIMARIGFEGGRVGYIGTQCRQLAEYEKAIEKI